MPSASLTALLAALEDDASLESGGPFLALTARHFASTASGAGPVSTGRSAAELSTRFDEPLPRGQRPLAEVVARLDRDVVFTQ